jgi:hypothetical protein
MKLVRFAVASRLCLLGSIATSIACGDAENPTAPIMTPHTGTVTAPIAGQAAPPAQMPVAGTGAAGVPAAPPATPVDPAPVAPAADATWCGVKRTLDAQCTACHDGRMTAGAPMALLSHADLTAPAATDASKQVYELVGARVHDTVRPMPPQGKLTAEQLAEIDAWVAAGAPAGEDETCAADGPAPEPTAPAWPDNCDETYEVRVNGGRPAMIAPGSETHPQFPVQPPWGNEEVQAIAWRAITDNAKVLHHWILYGPSREFLFGWAPGKDQNEPLPPDVGLFLPSRGMTLDVHYNNALGSQMETDESGFEICVLKRPNFRPKTAGVTMSLSSMRISVPPGAENFDVTGTCNHSGGPVRLLSASPHAHRTAQHMKFTVQKANGEEVVMHDDSFNFEEQTNYSLDPPVVIEAGDRIITTCTYTNDTDGLITFGQNTGNEMCFNFAIVEPMGGLNCGFGGFGQ